LDILVARLRRKVEPDPKLPRVILTVSGVGYKFGPLPRTEMHRISPLPSAGISKLEASSFALPSNDRHPRTVATDFAAPTLPSEKRQLTVLCCGLANTAEQFAKGDLEGVEHSIGVLRHTASEVVARLGGSIVRAAGEEILAVFGYPQAHEDDAERAVASGLELIDRLAEIRSATGAHLQAQLVIATGQVLVSDEREIIGTPLIIAERLRASARIDAVEVTAATQKLIHRAFDLDQPLSRQIEDVPRPMTTYRVVGRRVAKTRFESLRDHRLTPFIGRQKELEQLRSLWERARVADGQVALICGEPGIGKSRMFQALLDRVEDKQVAVILCQCSPHHLNTSYHPIIRYLEDAAGFDRDDPSNAKLEKLKATVSVTNCCFIS
jgi:class 3 adenylate cyclase